LKRMSLFTFGTNESPTGFPRTVISLCAHLFHQFVTSNNHFARVGIPRVEEVTQKVRSKC
jgi:hypothetical protein